MSLRRRTLLAAGLAAPWARSATGRAAPIERQGLAYVGSYTSAENQGVGPGITLVRMDPHSGALSKIAQVTTGDPSWIAIDPARRNLYALDEKSDGAVSAWAIDPGDFSLRRLNEVASGGAAPAYVSVHPSGRYVLCANYMGGNISVLPVRQPDGRLAAAADIVPGTGPRGPEHPATASDNHAKSDHAASHMHMVRADPTGRFVLAVDAGRDRIDVFSIDLATGRLRAAARPFVALEPGSAPRHLVFGGHGRTVYVLSEQDSAIDAFHFDPATGALTPFQRVRSLPLGFAGSNLAAELVISADGRFLYATQRLHDSISVLAIGADGRLRLIDETWTRGDYPRNCTIDPSGRFLFCANQRGDSITSFRIDQSSGQLAFTGQYFGIGSPVTMSFLS